MYPYSRVNAGQYGIPEWLGFPFFAKLIHAALMQSASISASLPPTAEAFDIDILLSINGSPEQW